MAALLPLIAQERAPAEARIFALDLLRERSDAAADRRQARDVVERGARGVPVALRSRCAPRRCRSTRRSIPGARGRRPDRRCSTTRSSTSRCKVAAALAWGEVAAANKDAATAALDKLLKDEDSDVRAAAAEAAGKLGRIYQDKLIKMAKAENYIVRIGAAEGLANTAIAGASGPVAVDGIAQLWREKGRPRRDAAKVFAHLAKKKPGYVIEYLVERGEEHRGSGAASDRRRGPVLRRRSPAAPMRAARSRGRPTIRASRSAARS